MRTVGSMSGSCLNLLMLVFALGVVGACAGAAWADAVNGGAFVYWQSLGLADQQGVDLLQTDAGLVVRTADGKQFVHRGGHWEDITGREVNVVPQETPPYPLTKPIWPPPGKALKQIMDAEIYPDGYYVDYYALVEGKGVWEWHLGRAAISDMARKEMCIAGGVVLGVITAIVIGVRMGRR